MQARQLLVLRFWFLGKEQRAWFACKLDFCRRAMRKTQVFLMFVVRAEGIEPSS
jgi:hypothetical protein